MINKRKIGAEHERLCTDYLKKNNVIVLATNYRNRKGEIDIIGKDENYLVFFEVKYRKTSNKGLAEESVDYRKQKVICDVSRYYMLTNNYSEDTSVRYDVLAINDNVVTWYKNAFDYI